MLTSKTYEAMLQLAAVSFHLDTIVKSGLSWECKFDQVFKSEVQGMVLRLAQQTDFKLDWCDPDGSYEDDVLAYVRAVDDFLKRLRAAHVALPSAELEELVRGCYSGDSPWHD